MAIFGKYQGGDPFNVAGNMQGILKGQQAIHDSMMGAVEKFNTARQEMEQLQATTGSILSQYKVDEKGNPDATAPKYVHDLFKAVNKEGGLANMSRSQMLAGIKAYEVGYGIEQQNLKRESDQLALQGARTGESLRRIQLEQAEMQIADIRRQREENEQIRKAREALAGEVEKISKTKTIKAKETKTFEYAGQKVTLTGEELAPHLSVLNNDKATDAEKEVAKRAIERMLYDKSSYSKKRVDSETGATWNPETLMDEPTEDNPLYREFKSVYDKLPEGPKEIVRGPDGQPAYKGIKPSSLDKTSVDAFISRQLREFNERKKNEEQTTESPSISRLRETVLKREKELGPIYTRNLEILDSAVKKLEQEISLGASPIEINAAITKIGREMDSIIYDRKEAIRLGREQYDATPEGRAYKQLAKDWDSIVSGIRSEMDFTERSQSGFWSSERSGIGKYENTYTLSELIEQGKVSSSGRPLDEGSVLPEQRLKAIQRIRDFSSALLRKDQTQKVKSSNKEILFETRPEIATKEIEVQREVQRSVEEQTEDEYQLMMNYFRATGGGVPLSFTKDAFYAMKGIVRPIVQDLGVGHAYVRAGGKEEIVKINQDGMGGMSSPKLTLRDQKLLWEAQQLSLQRNMGGLKANGYQFSGELRVGDIDTANKVRDGVLKSTRALQAVDRMIQIGENASLFDKLLPTEISGIAQSLTNAAQAANRTEIGGSGSWSNQDQVYMDKVIRDPSGGFNALFSTQTIASLKEYRRRLEQSLVDSGNVYGFAFERYAEGGRDNAMENFRMRFHVNLAKGMSQEEALSAARAELEVDTE